MSKIILIEDRQEFADQFKILAKSKSIEVIHKRSFDGLKELLPKYEHLCAGVIIDIKCLMKEDQEIEDANFIGAAMTYLDSNLPGYPRFILTGDDTEFNNLKRYYADEKLFLKTPQDLDKLFLKLRYCIDNSSDLRIIREYSSLFEILGKGVTLNPSQNQLLRIIKTGLIEENIVDNKGILSEVRSMQESIYKIINSKNKGVVPDSFMNGGHLKFGPLLKHLSGNQDRNNHNHPTTEVYHSNSVNNISNTIYWTCGEYIHEDPNRTYFISKYAVRSLINGLFELLLWSKPYMN